MKQHLLIFFLVLVLQVLMPFSDNRLHAEAIVSQTKMTLLDQLNAGWPSSLEKQLIDGHKQPLIKANKNYVFIFNYMPDGPLDLRSGELLHQSVQSRLFTAEGGHMMFGWQCQTKDRRYKGMAGFTGEMNEQSTDLIKNGWGLNAYLAIYTDGKIQIPLHVPAGSTYDPDKPRNLSEVIDRAVFRRRQDFAFILKEVSAEDCFEGLKFVADFAQRPIIKGQLAYRFTSLADPLKFEGAGCVSFGEAFMQKTKMFPGMTSSFFRELIIDERLLGYGEVNAQGQPVKSGAGDTSVVIPNVQIQSVFVPTERRRISSFRLMNINWDPAPDSKVFRLKQVDPELIYLFFKEVSQAILGQIQATGAAVSPILVNKIEQRRTVRSMARPDDFSASNYREYKIDRDFDVTAPLDKKNVVTNSMVVSRNAHEFVNRGVGTHMKYLIPMYHSYGVVLVKD